MVSYARWVQRAALCFLFAAAALETRGERLFVGTLEADSLQSVVLGASAFSRVAELPFALELINSFLLENLSLPSSAGVSPTDPFRIIQTVDPSQPLSAVNPANVAIVPLVDDGSVLLDAFSDAYGKRTENGPVRLFEQPKATNNAPRVALAIVGRHALVSPSSEALVWAWEKRAKLIEAPPQTLPGTVRVLVNPQRFADVLGTRSEKTASFVNIDKFIRDMEELSFSLTLDGQALTLAMRAKPAAEGPLRTLVTSLRPPAAPLWNGLPGNAFFASASACDAVKNWAPFLGQEQLRLIRPIEGLAPAEAFAGDRLLYLAPTKTKHGLCFVQIEPLRNPAPVRAAIEKLHTRQTSDGIGLSRRPARKAGAVTVETYDIVLTPPQAAKTADGKTEEPSVVFTLAALFLKQAVLETAATDTYLITVLGPERAIDDELSRLAMTPQSFTLNRQIETLDPLVTPPLCAGASLHVANLLRHIVSLVPTVKPEQLQALSTGGDGATFGLSRGSDQTITASLRMQSNEFEALQRMNRDGRDVLQEVFFQMFSNKLMDQKGPSIDELKKQQ
jgi:hypothetical protein